MEEEGNEFLPLETGILAFSAGGAGLALFGFVIMLLTAYGHGPLLKNPVGIEVGLTAFYVWVVVVIAAVAIGFMTRARGGSKLLWFFSGVGSPVILMLVAFAGVIIAESHPENVNPPQQYVNDFDR